MRTLAKLINYPFTKTWLMACFAFIVFYPCFSYGADRINLPGADTSGEETVIEAEHVEYDKGSDQFSASGNVVIRKGVLTLKGSHMRYSTNRLHLKSGIRFSTPDYELSADSADLNTADLTGEISSGLLQIYQDDYRVTGDLFRRIDENRFLVEKGTLTTCTCLDGKQPLWNITARRVELEAGRQISFSQLFFRVKGLPVFYLPAGSFPLLQERHTGFLTPALRYSKIEGLRLEQDFFLALSPSQDMTFSLDTREKKGNGGGVEYRYILSNRQRGRFSGTIFNDIIDEKQRWHFEFLHKYSINEHSRIIADIEHLNEIDIFTNQNDDNLKRRAGQNIVSNLLYSSDTDTASGYLLMQYTKSLQDPENRINFQKMPEFVYSRPAYKLGHLPLYSTTDLTATNFFSKQTRDIKRVDLNQGITYDSNYLFPFSIEATVRDTLYNGGESEVTRNRLAYYIASDLSTSFYRQYGKGRHIIRPVLEYEYLKVDGDEPANHGFGDGFDDIDNITAKSGFTLSISNHFITDKEIWFFRIYETLALNTGDGIGKIDSGFSDVRSEMIYDAGEHGRFNIDTVYSTRENRFSSIAASLQLSGQLSGKAGTKTHFMTIGAIIRNNEPESSRGDIYGPLYQAGRASAVAGRFGWWDIRAKLPFNITVKNVAFFDISKSRFTQVNYQVHLVVDCVEIMISYDDLPRRNQVRIMMGLKGLAETDTIKL